MKTIRIKQEQAETILDALCKMRQDSPLLNGFGPCQDGVDFMEEIYDILSLTNEDYGNLIIPPPPYIDIEIIDETNAFIMWLGCTLAYIYQAIEPPEFTGWEFNLEFTSLGGLRLFADDPSWYFPLDVLVEGCRRVLTGPAPTLKKINAMIDKYG